MAKKAKSKNTNGAHVCRLRVLRGRKAPHGPNGSRIKIELDLDQRSSLGVAAQILRLSR
ncbi:hypothetical protein DFP91_1576 [Pseudorhodoplanes sinuspersici]|nr:hypothetical protein DFP91_1576 [Pseudorhodoplanes sinuspersici]